MFGLEKIWKIWSSKKDKEALSSRNFKKSQKTSRDLSHGDDTTSINSCRDLFYNIHNNTLEDSHKIFFERRKMAKEEHMCFKASKEDDNIEITYLSYK